jgi:D-glycero-alpha-D-manno-heptose-7-phosphate kinase
MIISRTPFRMSFVGGGSDLASFYRNHGGAVLSTAINCYVNVVVNPKFDSGIRLSYSKTENRDQVDQVEHPIVREALRMLQIPRGIEIVSVADVPSTGTGLGSSSAFTVGLLNALHAFKGLNASKRRLGEESCAIEIDILKEPIGKQDQFASAYGGINLIRFNPDDSVDVEPVTCPHQIETEIERNIVAFYTGIVRRAGDILKAQNEAILTGRRDAVLKRMVAQVYELRDELRRGNCDALGEVLHEGWQLKKSISNGISSDQIDHWYDRAIKAGALGGKLLGAGAGGFLIFYARPERHEAIRRELCELRPIKFCFDREGSRIIFWDGLERYGAEQ